MLTMKLTASLHSTVQYVSGNCYAQGDNKPFSTHYVKTRSACYVRSTNLNLPRASDHISRVNALACFYLPLRS